MQADLAAVAPERFALAADILGWSVLDACSTDKARLGQTRYTQPCLYTIEATLVDVLRDRGAEPDIVAGHSLGEYVALYAAGVFSFAAGLGLVKRRAELMAAATGGQMVALMKFDRAALEAAIAATADVVLANDNSEQQAVISGTPAAVAAVCEVVKAKRALPLQVSGAFHSPLMAAAAAEFDRELARIDFQDARVPVLANIDPSPATAAATLKERLHQQMTGPVRWRELMLYLETAGIASALEIGPGNVLSGLLKRTCSGMATATLDSAAAVAEYCGIEVPVPLGL